MTIDMNKSIGNDLLLRTRVNPDVINNPRANGKEIAESLFYLNTKQLIRISSVARVNVKLAGAVLESQRFMA
jgi:hypothetical protein